MTGSSDPSSYEQFSRANCIRKGVLFGFALGMLAGLVWIGIAPPEGPETASIHRWGKVIVVGIGLGFLVGLCWPTPKDSHSSQSSSSSTDKP